MVATVLVPIFGDYDGSSKESKNHHGDDQGSGEIHEHDGMVGESWGDRLSEEVYQLEPGEKELEKPPSEGAACDVGRVESDVEKKKGELKDQVEVLSRPLHHAH